MHIYIYIYMYIPISAYCASVRYRFAVSESTYLRELRQSFFDMLGTDAPLSRLANRLPNGSIDSPSILQCLLDALDFQGPLQVVNTLDISSPHYWLRNYPVSPMPPGVKGIRSAVLKILSLEQTCVSDLDIILARKSLVTLGPELCGSIVPQARWFEKLQILSSGTNSYLRMCWLKAIGGAWTTTCRMHE